ncbi:MAG: hypothetical protein U0575_03735 [Phycisphaerales bacterium]|jgi:RNA polymerase sigma-70 factor (ECF subfamily)
MVPADPNLAQTDWSMIGRVSSPDEAAAAEALERVVRRYWPAVYAFIRRTGRDVHESSDLSQAFVAEVMLRRQLIEGADRRKGRFRHLLLRSLRNFLHEQHRFATRWKRNPRESLLIPLDAIAEPRAPQEADSPDAAFDRAWCQTLVKGVLSRVQEECQREGLDLHWQVFEARVVRPVLHGTEPIEYRQLAEELDLPGPGQAANLLVTVKRRFARALRKEIAATVMHADEIEPEVRDVLRLLEDA